MYNSDKNAKEIYNYCVENDWIITRIREFANSLEMPYENILYAALEYAKKNTSDEDYKEICAKVSKNKKGRYDINVPNPVLSKNGDVVYKLWRNDDEKNKVLKYIYDSWQSKEAKDIALEFGIDPEKVVRLVRDYAFNILKLSTGEWQELRDEIKLKKSHNRKRNNLENMTDTAKTLSQLIKANTIEEIVTLLDSVIDIVKLKGSVHDYLIIYHDSKDYSKYRDSLFSRFAYYASYQKEKRKVEKNNEYDKYVNDTLPNAIQLITTFVESDCNSIKEFINKYQIVGNKILNGEKIFNECLKLVKNHEKDLYKKYLEKVEKRRQQNYNIIANQVMTIISLLKNGIIENDVKRSFDVIDYFSLTRIPFDTMLKVAEDLMKKQVIIAKDYSLLARFYRSNLSAEKVKYSDIELILSEKQEINCEKNSKGYPISGTGEIISKETKEKLLNYLINNGFPINYQTYRVLFNRYKNGFLEFDDIKKY